MKGQYQGVPQTWSKVLHRHLWVVAFQCSAIVSPQGLLGLFGSPNVVEAPELINEGPSHGDEGIMGRREECDGRPESDNRARGSNAESRLAPGGADAGEAERNHREAVT